MKREEKKFKGTPEKNIIKLKEISRKSRRNFCPVIDFNIFGEMHN